MRRYRIRDPTRKKDTKENRGYAWSIKRKANPLWDRIIKLPNSRGKISIGKYNSLAREGEAKNIILDKK